MENLFMDQFLPVKPYISQKFEVKTLVLWDQISNNKCGLLSISLFQI